MKQETMKIIDQRRLAPYIYELSLRGELVKEMTIPGQFLHIRVPRADLLLRRPISVSSIDKENSICRIIYRIEGEGTRIFSELKKGDDLDILGPLGNGFDLSHLKKDDEVFIVGGGIGIPPLYELSKQLKKIGVKPIHFLGFSSKKVMYYEEEFKRLGDTSISTDDGSYGMQGNVEILLKSTSKKPKAVFACGANGLLKTIEKLYLAHPNVQLSLESRMACGIGACYACVCHQPADETGTTSVKVCNEGPIFKVGEVVL
ncbi:dihydroorotate dehydrogenase electron transfer subunit [Enterococcus ratti]|nr:dihydroorotate dehydrogenase electron transfer subunit [Enterococcus ratti]